MKKIISIVSFFLLSVPLFATHNRAGDITYKHISGLTYEVSVSIFADPNSPAFRNRDEVEINWGDNSGIDSVGNPIIGPDILNRPNVKKRTWIARHTFPGPGSFRIRVEDRNRNGGVDNITNSINVPFTVESLLRIPLDNQINNSVVLRNDPIDDACFGELYIYNPGAFDPDGDSLAYELASSLGTGGFQAPGFNFPSASISLTVDPISGDLIWDRPNEVGLYNLAIRIKEYRNGVLLGSVLRDLQIQVFPGCNNRPPNILVNPYTCVEAGKSLRLQIRADDPDINDKVSLSITGEILEAPIGSRVAFNSSIPSNPTNGTLIWNTICDDVRRNLYNISIKAEDDATPIVLSSFQNTAVKVVAPAPENLVVSPVNQNIRLNWINSQCQNALGYLVYRRIDSTGFMPDSCTNGVPEELGYKQIAEIQGLDNTSFLDENGGDGMIPGRRYCYLLTKYFADGEESLASEEVCGQIQKVVPIITQTSVLITDENNGQIQLEWSPPAFFDSLSFPPPYRYLIYQQENNDAVSLIDSTLSLNDTLLQVDGLNTLNNSFSFNINLLSLGSGRAIIGKTAKAQSIFLNIEPTDNVLKLNWEVNVPWRNDQYIVFKRNNKSGLFDSIATTTTRTFNDSNLTNGIEFCYYIMSVGRYDFVNVKDTIVNLSQISCSIPEDNIPPCAPQFSITSDCEADRLRINWVKKNEVCSEDVIGYRVYYSSKEDGNYNLMSEVDLSSTSFLLQNSAIAGCYSIRAIDSSRNESVDFTNNCVEFCPVYELPNVFTPNNDNLNDLFTPIKPYRDVDSINLVVYNRWGDIVFETSDPDINWNGVHQNSNEILSSGVYFYSCDVYEKSLFDSAIIRKLKGTITIFNPDMPIKTN